MSPAAMTSRERIRRMYEHKDADRVPVTDSPWAATLERWRREGLPADADFVRFFGLDHVAIIGVDNSPRYEKKLLEETPEYTVTTTEWGCTLKNWTHAGGVPEFLDFTVVDPASWKKAKERMTPTRDRVDWDHLRANYRTWRESGAWISAAFWFGFDVTHSWMVGTERVLTAMALDPDWAVDMFNHLLDMDLALFERVWDAGYELDEINWPDDMGYKGKPFFSPAMYRELLKPVHKRAADWAHARGVKVRLHSCGDIRLLIPDLLDVGIDMLNPVEVKAGMEPVALKRTYGERLAFHGGINAVLFDHPDQLWAEMQRVVPVMKQGGGYWCSSDHSVPQSVSLETFGQFVEHAKRLGAYG
jgi:uroporphyrinogen decarboxylase